jgi:hypothetical protein
LNTTGHPYRGLATIAAPNQPQALTEASKPPLLSRVAPAALAIEAVLSVALAVTLAYSYGHVSSVAATNVTLWLTIAIVVVAAAAACILALGLLPLRCGLPVALLVVAACVVLMQAGQIGYLAGLLGPH